MILGDSIHNAYCPYGVDCFCANTIEVESIVPIFSKRYIGKRKTLFHGTFLENLQSILEKGLLPEKCSDPSFGKGIYFSPCLRMSRAFAGNKGVIFICLVDVEDIDPDGIVLDYKLCDPTSTQNAKTSDGLEYVICSGEDIEIVGIIHLSE